MQDKKRAIEELRRLANQNFTDKQLKIKFNYEKEKTDGLRTNFFRKSDT